jgi:hypothetical protein
MRLWDLDHFERAPATDQKAAGWLLLSGPPAEPPRYLVTFPVVRGSCRKTNSDSAVRGISVRLRFVLCSKSYQRLKITSRAGGDRTHDRGIMSPLL